MTVLKEEFNPNWATHPGQHLKEYMEVHGYTAPWLARLTGIETEHIVGIIDKKEPITQAKAEAFERVFGLKVHIWLGLQKRWDEFQSGE